MICILAEGEDSKRSCTDLAGTLDSDEDVTMDVGRGNNRAFMQLLGLSQATLMPQALTFDIPISILLKGSRGIGKFTTAVQVARRLGMHVFEVGFRGLYEYDSLFMRTRQTAMIFSAKTTQRRRAYFVLASNKLLHVRPAYL